jgi:hypothetical protein
MDNEAIKRKKILIDAEIQLAKLNMEEAKTKAALAQQFFVNALNHCRDLEGLLKA